MRLPSSKRITKTDYDKKYQDLIDTLSYTINYQLESLFEALNNGSSLTDNLKCTSKSVTLQVDATGRPLSTTSFSLDVPGRIAGIECIRATNSTNSGVYPTSAPFVSFNQPNNNIITITNVTGLQAGNTYVLRLIAWNE